MSKNFNESKSKMILSEVVKYFEDKTLWSTAAYFKSYSDEVDEEGMISAEFIKHHLTVDGDTIFFRELQCEVSTFLFV
jgi:hypothetical protein